MYYDFILGHQPGDITKIISGELTAVPAAEQELLLPVGMVGMRAFRGEMGLVPCQVSAALLLSVN